MTVGIRALPDKMYDLDELEVGLLACLAAHTPAVVAGAAVASGATVLPAVVLCSPAH